MAADWHTRAACNGTTPGLWEPTRANTPTAVRAATHCRACPVRQPCYDEAADYGRTDGTVQGGAYWTAGKPIEIPELVPAEPANSRSQEATRRRRNAIGRYYLIRYQHENDAQAYRQLAKEYDVSESTVREWHRLARAEHSRRLTALNQTAREAP